jgi:hypothetical protein
MPNPFVLPLAILIGALFVFFLVRTVIRSVRFAKASRVTVSGDAQSGKILHMNIPGGNMDLQVHQTRDPGMESMPRYPGALPLDARSEYEMQLHVPGRDGRYIEQGFWTSDSHEVVLAFYQREFPDWKKDRYFMVGEPGGYRCDEQTPGRIRTIEIRWGAFGIRDAKKFPDARTVIKYSVLYGDHLPVVPTA